METISKLIANGEVRRAVLNTQKFFPGLWDGLISAYLRCNKIQAFYLPLRSETYRDLKNLLLNSEWIEEKCQESSKFYERRVYVTETQSRQGISTTEHILNLAKVQKFEVVTNTVAKISWLRAKHSEPNLFERTKTKRLFLHTGLYHGYEICYRFYHGIASYPTIKWGENYIPPSKKTIEIDYWKAVSMGYEWIETA